MGCCPMGRFVDFSLPEENVLFHSAGIYGQLMNQAVYLSAAIRRH
jgi:hypothetical protein